MIRRSKNHYKKYVLQKVSHSKLKYFDIIKTINAISKEKWQNKNCNRFFRRLNKVAKDLDITIVPLSVMVDGVVYSDSDLKR